MPPVCWQEVQICDQRSVTINFVQLVLLQHHRQQLQLVNKIELPHPFYVFYYYYHLPSTSLIEI
jgi:hypothetical protein